MGCAAESDPLRQQVSRNHATQPGNGANGEIDTTRQDYEGHADGEDC